MSYRILLRCPGCNARIKAPSELRGQRRQCPGCQATFVVAERPLEDSDPILVTEAISGAAPRERPA